MKPTENRLLRRLMPALAGLMMPALALLGTLIGWSSPSEAYVQQIVIDQTTTANYSPIPLGSSIAGPAVSYTIYTGRIFGALSPTNPLNAVITDINLAPTERRPRHLHLQLLDRHAHQPGGAQRTDDP